MVNTNNPMGLTRQEMLDLRKQKQIKPELGDRMWAQILVAIPKHLLKVTIFVVIGSFASMLYLIQNN